LRILIALAAATFTFAVLSLLPSVSHADQITVNFLAIISDVDDKYCQCIPDANEMPGDTLWGSYTYDSDTPDSEPDPKDGFYPHTTSPFGIEVHHKLYSWGSDSTNVNFWVGLRDSSGTLLHDYYELWGYDNLPDPFVTVPTQLIYMDLRDYSGNAISSDTLPSVPPNLDDWPDYKGLIIYGPDYDYIIYSDLIWVGFGNPPTGVQPVAPSAVFLSQNHPNPFSSSTAIHYDLPVAARATITVYDVKGRHVASIHALSSQQGTVYWNGRDENGRKMPSGLYFYRLEADGLSQTRKMVVLR